MNTDAVAGAALFGPRAFLNLLEPEFLVDVFLDHPPVGFLPSKVGLPEPAPAFRMSFNLLTSLEEPKKRFLRSVPFLRGLERRLQLPALFLGTTVSEYALYPASLGPARLIGALLETSKRMKCRLTVIKDLPVDSPLLSEEENRHASALLSLAAEQGFSAVWGQALAYVKVDFDSIEEYLQRQSPSRRKNLRRKLKTRASLDIEELRTGDPRFGDAVFVDALFHLYLNVYRQSDLHFDQLSPSFFKALLESREANGVVFLYRSGGELIGFNLCFVHGGNLIDKYIGFRYPEARETNLYFVSWFHNLAFAIRYRLRFYIAGWTDPEVKRFLGAAFTFTRHAVYPHNPLLRALLKGMRRSFEADHRRMSGQLLEGRLEEAGDRG